MRVNYLNMTPEEAVQRAILDDVVVARVHYMNGSKDMMIQHLLHRTQQLMERMMELECIAPRRLKVGDSELIYRCPADRVPLEATTPRQAESGQTKEK